MISPPAQQTWRSTRRKAFGGGPWVVFGAVTHKDGERQGVREGERQRERKKERERESHRWA